MEGAQLPAKAPNISLCQRLALLMAECVNIGKWFAHLALIKKERMMDINITADDATIHIVSGEIRVRVCGVSFVEFFTPGLTMEDTIEHLIKEHFNKDALKLLHKHIKAQMERK